MPSARELLARERASIVAPAGCGKTELIARAAAINDGKRILILTHTNAGLRALRNRLHRLRVSDGSASVDTIAGWALRYARAFPEASQHEDCEPMGDQWDDVYRGVTRLLDVRAVRAVVQASYGGLLVDEYQDCSMIQHELVDKLAEMLPTCVLGDPLQGIFGFGDGVVPWSRVTAEFPSIGELSEPWRWKARNEALGTWCLVLREALLAGTPIDLSRGPIVWQKIDDRSQVIQAYRVARLPGGVVVIRKWENQAHSFARRLGGRYRSMEEAEGRALRSFARAMDELEGPPRAAFLLTFATDCMTGLTAEIPSVAKALKAGQVPSVRQSRKHPEVVKSLIAVCEDRSFDRVDAAMASLEALPKCARFRELWASARQALKDHSRNGRGCLADTVTALLQQYRAWGRFVDPRIVSRTLLIKGLEFDHALVPAAEEFEQDPRPGDGARHFYVAATRASHSLTVLSNGPIVRFTAPSV